MGCAPCETATKKRGCRLERRKPCFLRLKWFAALRRCPGMCRQCVHQTQSKKINSIYHTTMHNPFIGCRFMATPGWPQCWGSSIAPMGGSGGHPQDTGGRSPSTNRPKGLRDSNSTLHLSSGPSLEANNCGVLHSKMQVHSDKALETCLISRTPRVPQATWKKGAAWQLDPAGTRTQGETPKSSWVGIYQPKIQRKPPKKSSKTVFLVIFWPLFQRKVRCSVPKIFAPAGLKKTPDFEVHPDWKQFTHLQLPVLVGQGTGGPRGDPPAQRGVHEGVGVVAEGQAVGGQLRLQGRPQDPDLKDGSPGLLREGETGLFWQRHARSAHGTIYII